MNTYYCTLLCSLSPEFNSFLEKTKNKVKKLNPSIEDIHTIDDIHVTLFSMQSQGKNEPSREELRTLREIVLSYKNKIGNAKVKNFKVFRNKCLVLELDSTLLKDWNNYIEKKSYNLGLKPVFDKFIPHLTLFYYSNNEELILPKTEFNFKLKINNLKFTYQE